MILRGAVNNELRRDEFFNLKYNKGFHRLCSVPRIEKLSYLFEKMPIVLGSLSLLATAFWVTVGIPIFTILSFLCCSYLARGQKPVLNCDVGLSNSSLAFSLIGKYAPDQFTLTVEPAWRSILKKKSGLNVFSFSTMSEVLSAHILGIWMIYGFRPRLFKFREQLHSYVVFDFVLHWIVLNRILREANTIYFVSDSDRWATLFSSLQIKSRKVLIQHGLFLDPDQRDNWRPKEALRYKLRNIHNLIVFDGRQELVYRHNVLSGQTKCIFQRQAPRFSKEIAVKSAGDFGVLAICSPGTTVREIADLKFIIKACPSVTFKIRPHPFYSHKRYKALEDENVFLDINEELELNYLVLFWTKSTLIYQLQKTDVTIVDMMKETRSDVVTQICNKVNLGNND